MVNRVALSERRLELARLVRGLVRDADARYLPNAVPINRPAVRTAADDLLAIADRLGDLEYPVAPRGVLLVELLLDDGSGPLSDHERSDELLEAVDTAAAALEIN
jgi:hypothetical protein